MKLPRLLDGYCGQGGAKRGYLLAGFDVTGVDNDPRNESFYGSNFVIGDAIDYIREEGGGFDVIHVSPPCWAYTRATAGIDRSGYPDLIDATRDALIALGKPYVIENVEQARSMLRDPMRLCGRTFGLRAVDDDGTPLIMDRHRLFESNVYLDEPIHVKHDKSLQVAGSYGGARRDKDEARFIRKGGYVPSFRVQQELLGITWMDERGMYLSLPPAYTHWVGNQLIERIA